MKVCGTEGTRFVELRAQVVYHETDPKSCSSLIV
jgi:hypothetical protein